MASADCVIIGRAVGVLPRLPIASLLLFSSPPAPRIPLQRRQETAAGTGQEKENQVPTVLRVPSCVEWPLDESHFVRVAKRTQAANSSSPLLGVRQCRECFVERRRPGAGDTLVGLSRQAAFILIIIIIIIFANVAIVIFIKCTEWRCISFMVVPH